MIKIYAITVFTILTLLTVSISLLKPEMTKPVQFAVNELQVTTSQVARNPNATNELPESIKIQAETNTKINVVEKIVENVSQKPKETVKNIEIKNNTPVKTVVVEKTKEQVKTVSKVVNPQTTKFENKTIEVVKPQAKVEQKELVAELPKSVKEIVQNVQKVPADEKIIDVKKEQEKILQVEQKPVVLPKVESKPIEQMTPEEIIKQAEKEDRMLNEREEIVVWNVWRSNLQNQIMQDTQVSAPLGTVFKFSFTVDKKGRISNLRTWAQPSIYNNVAINYLKPLIQSYQGKPILTFPSRTKRVITNVTGGFTISTEDKFSTPSDFSDIERIKTVR